MGFTIILEAPKLLNNFLSLYTVLIKIMLFIFWVETYGHINTCKVVMKG